MSASDDEMLAQVYADMEGTADHNEGFHEFLRQIKLTCPGTTFHGTDVGHQYLTIGRRYLAYAAGEYGAESEEVRETRKAIEQGKTYYGTDCDEDYRESVMVENFERAYDALPGATADQVVVGIYGSAHADPRAMSQNGKTKSMAMQLRERYGDVIAYERVSW